MVNTIQLLRDMIAIPSVNPMTTNSSAPVERAMGNFIETILARAGIDCERQQVAEGRDNVIGIVHANNGERAAGVMLNSHMDTVPIDNMSISPFDPVIKDGRIFGRGSCDAKASLAAMLTAVINYAQQSDRPATVVFAAMADEEFSFSGSWKLIEKQWPVTACVVGEPTRLRRVIAHKGLVRWRITVEGLSAHGATPELGRNAVYDAARVVLALQEFAQQLAAGEPHHLLGHMTLNVGRIAGGQSVNIVPDRCVLEAEMRLLPNADGKHWLKKCLEFVRARVGPEVRLTFAEPYLLDPAMETPANALIVTSLGDARQQELGDSGCLEGANYGTDGSKLASAGIQTVICGPGDITQAHTDSEFVEVEQVELAARVYGHLLSNWRFIPILVLLLLLCANSLNAQISRPRMLIGERDPLTGYKILRARYDAGARPPDDIDGWALTYLITGDETYARRAVQKIRESHTPEQVGSRTYPEYVKWSLAFDWLYKFPGFDSELKDRVASELLRAAEKMLEDQSLKTVELAMYHNYTVRYLTLALFALTAIEGHPSVETRAAPLRKHSRAVLDHILDLTNFITPDGGYHESMDYQRITYSPLAMMAELLRTAANSDPALRYTIFQHYTDTYLYKVLPDGTTARDDDNEFPYLQWEDNICFGYAVNRFKDPYAAWMLRESGWPAQDKWRVPITKFLWDDPDVKPRNPAESTEAEIPRTHFFHGVGHLIMRDGFGPDSTWIEFNSGPYLGKHDHLDQNHFVIYHNGYLATESGADYTDTESPHYLNYYRRTIAHNSMLVYQPGEKFFWAENLWPAANDGGQRMDSSRYWNTVRSREDFDRTRDLWATGQMEVTDDKPGSYVYARGNATHAYQPSKMDWFTRELAYTPGNNVLVVFDRVRTKDPDFKKVWLLHGVSKPLLPANSRGKDVGHGGTSYSNASTFTYDDGNGRLRVHALLPRERDLITRGGPGWEFWTPGDEFGGAWGSGKNWPLDPPAGGPLPADPYLRKMWKTFWGDDFEKLLPSNTRAVVPAAWRVEISPAKPAKEDLFLNVLEIGDKGDTRAPKVELVDGSNLTGALVQGGTVVLFATTDDVVTDGEVTIPGVETENLLITGLKPHATYELQMTGGRANWRGGLFNGILAGTFIARSNDSGVLYVGFKGQKDGRLRLRMLANQ